MKQLTLRHISPNFVNFPCKRVVTQFYSAYCKLKIIYKCLVNICGHNLYPISLRKIHAKISINIGKVPEIVH